MSFHPINDHFKSFSRANPQLAAAQIVSKVQEIVGDDARAVSWLNNRILLEVDSSAQANFVRMQQDDLLAKFQEVLPDKINRIVIRVRNLWELTFSIMYQVASIMQDSFPFFQEVDNSEQMNCN